MWIRGGQAVSDLVELIRFIANNGGGTSDGPNIVSIDDIYVLDESTRLGQCRVSTLLPDADTADADWTPLGAGNHFAEVDDDNGDTSCVASDTTGDLDMFDAQDLSFMPQTVHAVQISWRARKDDAATREVRSRIRSDAADGRRRHAQPDLEVALLPRYVRGRPRCRRAVDRGPPWPPWRSASRRWPEMAESRVTTVVAEVLSTGGAPNARVTTVAAEVLNTGGVPNARVTGLVAEVLHGLDELTAGGTGRKPIVVVVAG